MAGVKTDGKVPTLEQYRRHWGKIEKYGAYIPPPQVRDMNILGSTGVQRPVQVYLNKVISCDANIFPHFSGISAIY